MGFWILSGFGSCCYRMRSHGNRRNEIEWANEGIQSQESSEPTKDSNGTTLNEGDSVTIIKDLEVKGAGFTAKQWC